MLNEYVCNALSTIISIVAATFTYVISLLKLGGFTEEMLLAFPKGALIAKLAKKCKLI